MGFGVNRRHISLLLINDSSDKLSDCKSIHGLTKNQHRKGENLQRVGVKTIKYQSLKHY